MWHFSDENKIEFEGNLYDKASKHFQDFDIESHYDKLDNFKESELLACIHNNDID